ncbi:UNVERIFIED_CONTAM: hypothetical protein HDU68_008235 [Siphonaria sp. JEL0065]|nr:hypothetical protein HDU68_008235 [Siphonaria sp. JEL0065]
MQKRMGRRTTSSDDGDSKEKKAPLSVAGARRQQRIVAIGAVAAVVIVTAWMLYSSASSHSATTTTTNQSNQVTPPQPPPQAVAGKDAAPETNNALSPSNNTQFDTSTSNSNKLTKLRLPAPLRTASNPLPAKPEYSRFSCLGDDNRVSAFRERICVFNNVCYNYATDRFTFHTRKVTDKKTGQSRNPTVLFDSTTGERTEFVEDGHGFVALWQTTDIFGADLQNTWGPQIENTPVPSHTSPSTTITLPNLHAVWSLWAYDDNLGHMLWEEMAGLYYAMTRMDVLTDSLVPLHYPWALPDRKLGIKFRNAFFSGISNTPPQNLRDYIYNTIMQDNTISDKRDVNVCFEQLLVGGNMRRFLHAVAWHNHGHEPMFKSLRARILEKHGIDPTSVPTQHHILITNKTETNFKADQTVGSRKRAIYNLEQVMAHVKETYPGVKVTCIEWQKHSVADQLKLVNSATVFISPPGGVSMMLPFLPPGSHAIIMDYLENEPNNWYGTQVGDSISMEAPFWNHWPHVKKLYYQIRGPQDLVSDSTSKSLEEVSWREGVSYNLDMGRLGALLQQAFDDMEN